MLVLSHQIQIIILSRKSWAQEMFSCFQLASVHFQFHVAKTNAVAIAALSSQNPGVFTIANAVFGSNPPINPDVLTEAFQLRKNVVSTLQKQLGGNK